MKKLAPLVIALSLFMYGCVSSSSQQMKQIETEEDNYDTASPTLGIKTSLDDYIQYALLNNPGLKSAFSQWKAAVERIPQAKSLSDPQFNYAYFIEEVETRVGPQEQKSELMQMFPWFGTLGKKEDIATLSAKAAYQQFETAKLKLLYTVKNNYYEYYYLARAISITEHNMTILSELEEIARSKFKNSNAKYNSLIKVQVELGRLEDKLQSLKIFRRPLAAKLNASLNLPSDYNLPYPTAISNEEVKLSHVELAKTLIESNPELMALKHIAEKESANMELAGKSYYPDVILGAGYIQTGEADMPDVRDSGKDAVTAMIGLSIPIWQGKYRAEANEYEARAEAAKQKLADRENNLLADLQLVFYHWQDTERKIKLYQDGLLPKARESLNISKQSFQTGSSDFLEVIDAERILLEFELAYERALVNRAQRLAELEMIIGRTRNFERPTSK